MDARLGEIAMTTDVVEQPLEWGGEGVHAFENCLERRTSGWRPVQQQLAVTNVREGCGWFNGCSCLGRGAFMCALVDEAAYQNSKGPFDLTPIFWWLVLPYKISEFLKKIRKITSFQFNNSLYFRGRYLFSGFFSATFI